MSKNKLRKLIKLSRNSLDFEFLSLKILEQIKDWDVFLSAQCVLAYFATDSEINVNCLIDLYPAKNWYLPKVMGATEMFFLKIEETTQFSISNFGIKEPVYEVGLARNLVTDVDVQLIFVPALAFDFKGHRLGYGKGYYDRFLAQLRQQNKTFITVGITAECLMQKALPADEWDVAVDYVVTENGIYKTPFSKENKI